MAIMSFAMAGILTTLFILLLRGNRGAFYLLLGFFGLTSLLTIFDDVGLSDIVVLILNILPVVLLVWDRRWYLWDNNPSQTSKVSDEL
jgi:predicted membrane channel-forming protein YqfA (hemolysin III family)